MVRCPAWPIAFTLAAMASFASPAHAGLVFSVSEVGNDVVVSASGSLDTSALTLLFSGRSTSYSIDPESGAIGVGSSGPYNAYGGYSGPAAFGGSPSFSNSQVSSASGDLTLLTVFNNRLYLSQSYVSGTQLSGTSTYANRGLADLMLTAGTSFNYTWGSGATADFITASVSSTVPEPAGLALLGTAALAGLATMHGRRRASTP